MHNSHSNLYISVLTARASTHAKKLVYNN